MLRSLIERVTGPVRFKRRLPSRFGHVPLCVSTSGGGLRYLFRSSENIDPTLLDLVDEFVAPNAVVWDVGANVGLVSMAAAFKAGRGGLVLAVEPDVVLVDLLRRSARMQPPTSAPVQVLPVAIAESVGPRTFCISTRARSANFLSGYGSTQTGGTAEEHAVQAVTLDWLSERYPLPDVLKIDVEGAELEVFQGAKRLLERKHPVILCEVGDSSSRSVAALLTAAGYQLYDGELPRSQRKAILEARWSTVAVPTAARAPEVFPPVSS